MAGDASSVVDAGELALDAASSVPGMTPGVQPVAVQSRARCARIVELDRSIAALTSERAALLVAERDCGQWKKAGYPSFEAWRGHVSGEGRRTARQLAVATALEESAETAEAVASGTVTLVHAEVLGRVRAQVERTSGGPLTSSDTQELLSLAAVRDADAFAKEADVWVARRDSVAHDATHEEMRRRRFLSVSHTAAGTHLKGFLDVVAGQTLQIALEAAMNRPEVGDDRDHGQRCADALVDVAERAVNGGSLKGGALVRPHVSVIMTEATFAQASRELRRRTAQAAAVRPANARPGTVCPGTARPDVTRSNAENVDSVNDTASTTTITSASALSAPGPAGPVTFEDGTPVPLTEVARILCDAELTRIVVDADDVPVNLGRTVRLYSREQRRAIIARDRGCQFTGCTKPARWCEVHHIDWWDRDQGTRLSTTASCSATSTITKSTATISPSDAAPAADGTSSSADRKAGPDLRRPHRPERHDARRRACHLVHQQVCRQVFQFVHQQVCQVCQQTREWAGCRARCQVGDAHRLWVCQTRQSAGRGIA